jgi:hypothetical protein
MRMSIVAGGMTLTATVCAAPHARAETISCGTNPCLSVTETGSAGYAIHAITTSSSTTVAAVHGVTGNGGGVQGIASGSGFGVEGSSSSGYGVAGASNSGIAVSGISNNNIGVYGQTSANTQGVAAGFFSTGAGSNSTALAAENSSSGPGLYASSNGGFAGYFAGNVGITGSCTGCGGGSSDIRLKKNVKPVAGALEQLLQLKGVTFEWIEPEKHGNETGTQRGFVAQEVEKVFPNWVREGNDGFKVLDYRQTEALEVESIRALKAENDALKARVKTIEDARRPFVSMNANGFGLTLGGVAIAGALMVSRRKRDQDRS